jgi:hypothetical protein
VLIAKKKQYGLKVVGFGTGFEKTHHIECDYPDIPENRRAGWIENHFQVYGSESELRYHQE